MKIGVCLIVKDEGEYLCEWIEHHRRVGVSQFYIYDNNSKIPVTNFLGKEQDIIIKEWPLNCFNSQWLAYNDCWSKYKSSIDKIAFIDVDEFICFDSKFSTIQEAWKYLESKYNEIDNLGIYWRMYGKSYPYYKTRQLVTHYTEYFEDFHIKSILDPKTIARFTDPHHAKTTGIYVNERNESIVSAFGSSKEPHNNTHCSNVIWIKHIWTRSLIEFKNKINKNNNPYFSNRTINEFFSYNDRMRKRDVSKKNV
jgi:hypothetical protein